VQLTTSATGVAEVVGWYAGVETDPGIATVVSRPVITRPSLLGTDPGTRPNNIVCLSNPGASAAATSTLLTAFGTPPSYPSVSPFTTFGAWDVQWAAGPGEGLIVLPGQGLLLYAIAGSTGAWNGLLEWEED
jgi:hypothetical protein